MAGGVSLYPAQVIGHRGACALAPENTLASIRRAAADGARMVEVDVKLTADGRPIIFHDDRLERTTDGVGPVASTTLEVIGALDAGGWFDPAFAHEPVPTLEELLDTVVDHDLAVNLEIKPCPGRDSETARVAMATALECWPDDMPPPLVSSFSREALAVARDLAPNWPRALLADQLPGDWQQAALVLDLKAFHLGDEGLTRADVDAVVSSGRSVAVWTVNDPPRAVVLWTWGVAAVFTDDPAVLKKVARQG